MDKTLEDALAGLLQYWQARPNGGTRAELIQLATAQGFVEPLLNGWLNVFLAGFVEIGWIDAPDYDQHLAPRVAAVGLPAASRAAMAVFNLLNQRGDDLDIVRKQDAVARLNDQIAVLNLQLARVQTGRANVLSGFPANAVRAATLAALDFAIGYQQRSITSATTHRDELQAEIAAAGS